MNPVEFRHQNKVYAKNQPQYRPLPALELDTDEGEVISCWKLTLSERLKLLFTGRMWVSLMMFHKPLTPSKLSVNRQDVYSHPEDRLPKWERFKIWLLNDSDLAKWLFED